MSHAKERSVIIADRLKGNAAQFGGRQRGQPEPDRYQNKRGLTPFWFPLAGGGFKGGTVYGKTDEGGENVIENPVNIQDFNATIAYAMGMPLDQILYSPGKRPFTVAHKGEPVLDLFI